MVCISRLLLVDREDGGVSFDRTGEGRARMGREEAKRRRADLVAILQALESLPVELDTKQRLVDERRGYFHNRVTPRSFQDLEYNSGVYGGTCKCDRAVSEFGHSSLACS